MRRPPYLSLKRGNNWLRQGNDPVFRVGTDQRRRVPDKRETTSAVWWRSEGLEPRRSGSLRAIRRPPAATGIRSPAKRDGPYFQQKESC